MAESLSAPTTRGPGNLLSLVMLVTSRSLAWKSNISFPQILERIPKDGHVSEIFGNMMRHSQMGYVKGRVIEAGEQRLKDMNEGGIAVQILSMAGAVNSTHFPRTDSKIGIEVARDINGELKKIVDTHPTRYKAFAALPMHDPQAAVAELHRASKSWDLSAPCSPALLM